MNEVTKVFCEMTNALLRGVDKKEFEAHYRGKRIAPGVNGKEHLHMLRLTNSLEETETTMKLKHL